MRTPAVGVTITRTIEYLEVAMEAHEELGPVDIVVIGFPKDAPMSGESVPILMDLVERGIIRVLDAMFVEKGEDGSFVGFEASGLDDKNVGEFRAFEGASSGLLGDDDISEAANALAPGDAAGVFVYENVWAAPFAVALRRAGGQLVASGRIPVQAVIAALDAIEPVA